MSNYQICCMNLEAIDSKPVVVAAEDFLLSKQKQLKEKMKRMSGQLLVFFLLINQ